MTYLRKNSIETVESLFMGSALFQNDFSFFDEDPDQYDVINYNKEGSDEFRIN